MALQIFGIPALSDNYIWLVHDPDSGATMVVDPGDAAPVLAEVAKAGWTIDAVWNTHWHPDHTGGNAAIQATGATVIAPAAEAARIPTADRLVGEGDVVMLGAHAARVWEVPGHTAGHIAFHFEEAGVIFTGDTLFAMGCGRLFEGTPAQMFAAMQRFAGLPDDTRVYCGHEYTQANGRFARVVEPDNSAIRDAMLVVDSLRADGRPTVPTTIGMERATNPFLRADSVAMLAERRAAKDAFRG